MERKGEGGWVVGEEKRRKKREGEERKVDERKRRETGRIEDARQRWKQ